MKRSVVLVALFTLLSFTVQAGDQFSALKKQLSNTLKADIHSIKTTPFKGLLEIKTQRGIVYSSEDGNYLVQGELYSISNGVVNLTEQSMSALRLDKLTAQQSSMIVYPAKNEKYVVTVFTDVDCGYCRKLHQQIAGYNDLGITIQYLAFPRGGRSSNAYSQMEAIWCADDPAKAMTDAKNGKHVASKKCDNPVAEHYALGNTFGVRGTPALVLENGTLLPGYLPPQQLLAELNKRK